MAQRPTLRPGPTTVCPGGAPAPGRGHGPPTGARDSGPRELGGTGLRGRLAGADRRPDPGNAGGGRNDMGVSDVSGNGADPGDFNRRKIYVEGTTAGVRVPFVEVTLSP